MKLSMKQAYLNAHHQGQPQPSPGMPSTGSVPSPEVNWQPSPNDSPMNAGNTYDTFQDAINAARGEINDAQQGGFADDMTRIKGALPPGMNIHPMEQFDPSTDPNRMKLDMKQTYLNNQFQDNLGQHQEGSPGHLNTFFQNAIRHGIDPNLISQFINHRVGVGIPRQPIKKK
jgi:hypothetical protein